MRNFIQFLPEEKKADVTADYDSIHAMVQGFNIGVRVKERIPYSRIEFQDDGAPFKFFLTLHFDAAHNGVHPLKGAGLGGEQGVPLVPKALV